MAKIKLPKVEWQLIGPAEAEGMLEKLKIQRRLIANHIAFLAEEMRSGRWWINGDTIRFSATRLLDGQHRLHALIQAGVKLWFLVVEEIDDDAYDSIDTGRGRQAGDVLYTLGYGQGFMVAATARFMYYYDNKMELSSSLKLSNHQVVDVARKYPFIKYICEYLVAERIMRASSIAAALTIIAKRAGREQAMYYADKLVTGADLKADDPVKVFRDKWLQEKPGHGTRKARTVWVAICIKTYNSWMMGRKATQVERFAEGERFPDPIKPSEKGATNVEAA